MSNSLSLYEITNAFPVLMENEEITDEEKKKIQEELIVLLQKKSQNIIGYIKNIELTVEAMKTEEQRISEQRKKLEKRMVDFKKYVKECMENTGISKIETGLGTLALTKNPISVEILNETLVPVEYKIEEKIVKINKKAIADNFKETGEIPEGINILSNNYSLRIK